MDVAILAETELPPEVDSASLEALVAHTLRAEGASGSWEVTVVLTTDDRLRVLHRTYMDIDTVTDVMTFPYDAAEPFPVVLEHDRPRGGDIVVSLERAAAQAADEQWSTTNEVRFLVCHGVLHLLGWDDTEPGQREAMLNRQRALLESLDRGEDGTAGHRSWRSK